MYIADEINDKILTIDDDTDILPPCSKCNGCEFD